MELAELIERTERELHDKLSTGEHVLLELVEETRKRMISAAVVGERLSEESLERANQIVTSLRDRGLKKMADPLDSALLTVVERCQSESANASSESEALALEKAFRARADEALGGLSYEQASLTKQARYEAFIEAAEIVSAQQ